MKGDSIVYILQLAAGREFDQVLPTAQNEPRGRTVNCYCQERGLYWRVTLCLGMPVLCVLA